MTLLAVRNEVIKFTGRKDLDIATLLTNGSVADSPYGWDLQDGWAWSSADGGKITHTPGSIVNNYIWPLSQFFPFVRVGLYGYYKVAFTISGRTAGSVAVYLGDNTHIGSADLDANDDYEVNLWCQDMRISFYPSLDFDGSISSVSVVDLAADSYAARADFFINQAQKYLDSLNISPKQDKWYKQDIAADEYTMKLRYCTALKRVYVSDDDGERELKRLSVDEVKSKYSTPYSNLTSGTPYYYCIFPIGLSPEQADLTEEDYTDEFTYSAEAITFGDQSEYRGLLLLPPADKTYTISILGSFMSPALSSNGDKSYWTEVRPFALVLASCMLIECAMRNSSGYDAYHNQLHKYLSGIHNEQIRERLATITTMKGERGL